MKSITKDLKSTLQGVGFVRFKPFLFCSFNVYKQTNIPFLVFMVVCSFCINGAVSVFTNLYYTHVMKEKNAHIQK